MRVQLNVAREMHDVVGHTLGVIAAEAGVTRALPDTPEAELRETLADIETHARDALKEMQGLVRTLRDSGPGLSELPAIIATTRAAGVAVHARLEPHGPVDAEVGAAMVRIAQEALNNVVRHAPQARCTVELCETEGTIALRVPDSGAPGTSPVSPVPDVRSTMRSWRTSDRPTTRTCTSTAPTPSTSTVNSPSSTRTVTGRCGNR
ncbi:histidine kinase [Plantactinospora sp. ZYX-F-223]|uniref:sensor histidine kinase n=1 Tax=Plantactinospora sp. ZYX-F-223 TaxID=3144103 RepID=UPI0031FDFD9B